MGTLLTHLSTLFEIKLHTLSLYQLSNSVPFVIYQRVKYCSYDEKLPILLQNLRELQLILCHSMISSEDLDAIYAFFRHCPSPFIEKLFIKVGLYYSILKIFTFTIQSVNFPQDLQDITIPNSLFYVLER